MYIVQTRYKIFSMHLTQAGARRGIDKALQNEYCGNAVFTSEVAWRAWVPAVLTVVSFAAIGVMLAWRG